MDEWMDGWMDGWKINLAEFFLIKLHIHPKRIERESAKVIMGYISVILCK